MLFSFFVYSEKSVTQTLPCEFSHHIVPVLLFWFGKIITAIISNNLPDELGCIRSFSVVIEFCCPSCIFESLKVYWAIDNKKLD